MRGPVLDEHARRLAAVALRERGLRDCSFTNAERSVRILAAMPLFVRHGDGHCIDPGGPPRPAELERGLER